MSKRFLSTTTRNEIIKFLYKSFIPVRLIFPRNIIENINPLYKNFIFNCQKYDNNLSFNNCNMLTPATYIATVLDKTYKSVQCFDLGKEDNCRSEERRVGKECKSRWEGYH